MSDHRTPAEIEADIERQRDRLAETVDQLTAKLDVKSRARAKASDLTDKATTDSGRPRPELLAAAVSVVVLAGVFVWWRRR